MAGASLLASCGSPSVESRPEITADTKCSDYLQFPEDERRDAAVRHSAEFKASGGGSTMWALNLDQACGARGSMTIREYFEQP